ncbi:MAG: DUF4340 domain-containing protein [Phycisphaerales bacterium]|nr:DUF4340 domain-containing protein [Phycisphaerales bacterium]
MRWLTLLWLWSLVVIVALASLGAWSNSLDQRGVAAGRDFELVIQPRSVDWELLQEIEITRGGDSQCAFRKRDGQWFQVRPFEFPVESAGINQLIECASALRAQASDPHASMPSTKEIGLSSGAPSIRFDLKDHAISIRLGNRLPAGFAWIQAEDGPPRIARSTLHDTALLSDLRQWRRTLLFSRADVDCDRIVCQSTGRDGKTQRLEVARTGASWKVISPFSTRADSAAVERWLDALARAQATGFVVDDPKELLPFGLHEPSAFVEIHATMRSTTMDGRVTVLPLIERLEIGAPIRPQAAERFARLSNAPQAIMELDGTAVAAAVPQSLLMVDPTATGVRPQDVRSIRVEPLHGSAFRLQRIADVWKVIDAEGTSDASTKRVEGVLATLCTARATDIMLTSAPIELVVGTIVLESFDDREIATVTLSRERDGGRVGMGDGSVGGSSVLRIFPASLAIGLDARTYRAADESDEAKVRPSAPSPTPPQ